MFCIHTTWGGWAKQWFGVDLSMGQSKRQSPGDSQGPSSSTNLPHLFTKIPPFKMLHDPQIPYSGVIVRGYMPSHLLVEAFLF